MCYIHYPAIESHRDDYNVQLTGPLRLPLRPAPQAGWASLAAQPHRSAALTELALRVSSIHRNHHTHLFLYFNHIPPSKVA